MSQSKIADAAVEMINEIEKTYTYEKTKKDGTKISKTVTRKYTNKKDTSNTLQNKNNKQIVEQNIIKNYDEIMKLDERKRMKYITDKCLPENVTASYNTLRRMLTEIINTHSTKED